MHKTEEQQAICSIASETADNLLISALAGTGKTSTIELIQGVVNAKAILYLCFNKAIAKEAEERFPSTTVVRTFNSLGHRIWAKTCPQNLSLDPKKSITILREIIQEIPKRDQGPIWDSFWEIVGGVAMAKSLGYIPEGVFPSATRLTSKEVLHSHLDEAPDALTQDLIDEVLIKSIKLAYKGKIDYNDQVYMPALFGGSFPQFPLVCVDEAQDLNPVNHQILAKLGKQRVMVVGDPFQSIYGFRGAVQSGMERLKAQFSMTEAPLSVSFRCPKAIVENARWRAPHYKWSKEGGEVGILPSINLADIPDNSVILSRNNAPLFRMGLRFLISGRGVTVSGSDVGPKILALMKKLGDGDTPKASLIELINDWEKEKTVKASKTAKDIAECMRVFAEHGQNLTQALAYADHLFKSSGQISLMTGHKSKGLEFNEVYHLDPWLIGPGEQEDNLRYVIQTRSKNKYFEINSAGVT